MCSRLWVAVNSIAISFLLGACNLKVGDGAKNERTVRLQMGCLTGVEARMNLYLEGNLNDQDIVDTAACVRGALEFFDKTSRGQSPDGFKPDELSGFLNRNFLGDAKITPGLLKELMNFKLLVVGGRDDFVTNAEFRVLIDLIDLIETEALRNRPFIAVYRRLSKANPDLLHEAKAQLERTVLTVAGLFKSKDVAYSIESFENLVREVAEFINTSKGQTETVDEKLWGQFAVTLRDVAVGERTGKLIYPGDWVALFSTSVEWFGVYLEYEYLLAEKDLRFGENLEHLRHAVLSAVSLVESAINAQKSGSLSFGVLDRIVDHLHALNALPKRLRVKESVKPVLHYVVSKMFRDPRIPLQKADSDGLTVLNLNEMRKEFLLWAETQRQINSAKATSLAQLDQCQSSIESVRCLVDRFKPWFRPDSDLVWVLDRRREKESPLQHSPTGLSTLNTMRSLSRLLIRGWAKDPDRATAVTGITERESEDFYETVKEIGRDLRFMDPRRGNQGARFFNEANLFTFSGNGRQLPPPKGSMEASLMTQTESVEQLALVWSGGEIRDRIYAELHEECRKEYQKSSDTRFDFSEFDPLVGYPMLPRECVERRLVRALQRSFENLPGLFAYLNALSPEGLGEASKTLYQMTRNQCQDPKWVEFSEFGVIGVLPHYLEVVFTRFDRNSDGVLSRRELELGYKIFRVYLAEEVRKFTGSRKPEGQLKAVFMYLLSRQRLPLSKKEQALVWWWDQRYFDSDPDQFEKETTGFEDFSIDRLGLLKVLSELSQRSHHDEAGTKCSGYDRSKGRPSH
jgi:hypothetical protein